MATRWGKWLLDGILTLKSKTGFALWRRYRLPLVGVLILLLAFVPSSRFPQWHVYVTQFLGANLLFTGALLLMLLFLLLWKLPQWQVADVWSVKDRLDLESKSRQTMAQIVGGAVLLIGLYFTSQTLRTTQEGQITDRFTKAIDQLGKDNLAVRLGGIYALERIARDSESDRWAVMEVLTAFVRGQVPVKDARDIHPLWNPVWKSEEYEDQETPVLRTDIQAILAVLGQRTTTYKNGEMQLLNLSNTNLQRAYLRGANLHGANLAGANLQWANFGGAKLQGADLQKANLQWANLRTAKLQGADLQKANLQWAKLEKANLQGANLREAYLQQASLPGAKLQRADLWTAKLQRAFLLGANLHGANLAGANLQGALLLEVNLQRANLAGANLQGTNLAKADLTETLSLTQDQVNVACIDDRTRLPEGLTRPAPCPPTRP